MRARATAALLLACAAFLQAFPVAAAGPAWQAQAKVPGIFDVGGPRPDGWLVVAGAARLWLVDPQGAVTPFAQGPGGYSDDRGGEAYLAVSPGLHPGGPGCDFAPGDVYVLRLHPPLGVTKVDVHGQKSNFANVAGVSSLNGIAFDTVGYFGHRLLITGALPGGRTEIAAVDCSGGVQVLTTTAPTVEGGMAVAPIGSGDYAGRLVAADELSGNLYAFGADGSSTLMVRSGLPTGGDIGVESVGFVPAGFGRGGSVFYADRSTPGNPHPGTDSLLALSSDVVTAAGVHEGDLLAVTEGGASVIGVHCANGCSVIPVVTQPTTAHGEGHVIFTVTFPAVPASPSPSPSSSPSRLTSPSPVVKTGFQAPASPAAYIAIVIVLVVLGAGALAVVRARWR